MDKGYEKERFVNLSIKESVARIFEFSVKGYPDRNRWPYEKCLTFFKSMSSRQTND